MESQKQINNEQKLAQIWRWKSEERYYIIRLQRNLFGEWSLLKSWGGLKNKLGGYSVEMCKTYESAMDCILKESRRDGLIKEVRSNTVLWIG